jgi:hypothetical protein
MDEGAPDALDPLAVCGEAGGANVTPAPAATKAAPRPNPPAAVDEIMVSMESFFRDSLCSPCFSSGTIETNVDQIAVMAVAGGLPSPGSHADTVTGRLTRARQGDVSVLYICGDPVYNLNGYITSLTVCGVDFDPPYKVYVSSNEDTYNNDNPVDGVDEGTYSDGHKVSFSAIPDQPTPFIENPLDPHSSQLTIVISNDGSEDCSDSPGNCTSTYFLVTVYKPRPHRS